jgi:hypothetical protein
MMLFLIIVIKKRNKRMSASQPHDFDVPQVEYSYSDNSDETVESSINVEAIIDQRNDRIRDVKYNPI